MAQFNLSPDGLDKDLVLEFFWKFSVFECALKREGFLSASESDAAQANWDDFGRQIEGKFKTITVPGFRQAFGDLIRLSPKRQIVKNGQLRWATVNRRRDDSDETFTLRLLKTSRNNLFHGGKYPDGPISEVARNQSILRAGLIILDGCYEIHAGVQRWIHDAA